ARHSQNRRLLLHAARVGEHEPSTGLEGEEVEVADRLDDDDSGRRPELLEVRPAARMGGKDQRELRRDLRENVEQCLAHREGIDQSRLRSPASTCATSGPTLAATSAHASVEFTSPTTTTTSGSTDTRSGSKASITRAVWSACVPDPTPSQ